MTAKYRKPAPKVHWDPDYPMSGTPVIWSEEIAVSWHYLKVGITSAIKNVMNVLAVIAAIACTFWWLGASIMCVGAPTILTNDNPMARICTPHSLTFALSSIFWATAILGAVVFGFIGYGKELSEGSTS